jgi:hypothetical protein
MVYFAILLRKQLEAPGFKIRIMTQNYFFRKIFRQ